MAKAKRRQPTNFYSHLFRSKLDGQVHAVVNTLESMKRTKSTRTLCAKPLPREHFWRRPPMGTPDDMGITCETCLRSHTGLMDLLEQ